MYAQGTFVSIEISMKLQKGETLLHRASRIEAIFWDSSGRGVQAYSDISI